MINYKYNELGYAKLIYEKGFQTKHIPTELRLLAVYMRDILGMKPKERRESLYTYCETHIPNYNRAKHFKMINKALQQSTKKTNKLIMISHIDIYENEVNYINSIKLSDNHKKVLFALLVQKKLSKIVYDIKNSDDANKKEYSTIFFNGGTKIYNNIKKIANIPLSIKINDDIIHDLSNYQLYDIDDKRYNKDDIKHLVTLLSRGLILLNYLEEMSEADNIAITIKNFENVGWYLDYYNNMPNIKLCKQCNQPFKQSKHDILYCSEHKGYQPIGIKVINCADCGKETEVDSKDNETCRCEECKKIYVKERDRLRKQRYRQNLSHSQLQS